MHSISSDLHRSGDALATPLILEIKEILRERGYGDITVCGLGGSVLSIHAQKYKVYHRKQLFRPKMARPSSLGSAYATFKIRYSDLQGIDYFVLLAQVPEFPYRVYVIPTRVLKRKIKASASYRMFYCRLNPDKKKGGPKPIINFQLYENAWRI
jgi:hypothetical protein